MLEFVRMDELTIQLPYKVIKSNNSPDILYSQNSLLQSGENNERLQSLRNVFIPSWNNNSYTLLLSLPL